MNALQQKQLDMLKVFIDICDKHNLHYVLVCGTCLGAVRHQGFIPWDDDIDVGMLREDYDKFLEIAPKELEEKYFLQTYKTDPNFVYGFAKIRDNTTTYIEDMFSNHQINHGIWIDIFPLDGYTNKKNVKLSTLKRKMFWFKFHVFMAYLPGLFRKIRKKTFFKDILLNIVAILFFWLNIGHFHQKRIDKMGHKYPTNEATLVGSFLYSFTGRIEALPPEIFKETIEVPFEGIKARIPKDYDTYLKCLYGDYMKLPPEEKRIGHHYSKALSYDIGWEDYIYKGKR